jgi:hypothetical protein
MPATFELRCEPDTDKISNRAVPDQVPWQAQHVDIVVPPAHFCHHFISASGSSDTVKLIGGDSHTETGTADKNTSLDGSIGDAFCNFDCEVGVVHRLIALRAKVFNFVAVRGQQSDELGFDLKPTMIAT